MVELSHVSFSYSREGEDTARSAEYDIRDVSLSVRAGEVVVLCGESGCGKSTVTRLVNGLAPHFYQGKVSGRVVVRGRSVPDAPLHETSRAVGSVFQNPRSQFFNVDTTSEIAFACENQGIPETEIRRRVHGAADELGILKLLGRNIFHLSGGEKQKIACASVSASLPDVIVLDEPSSNLDPASIAALARIIGLWKKSGKAVLLAEHRLYYLRGLADRFLYMKGGGIQGEYSPDELAALADSARGDMGLRAMDLGGLPLPGKVPELPDGFGPGEIRVTGMTFSYPRTARTLSVGSLEIPAGSVVAIVGPNGAGKTTLARCLCGMEKRCEGTLSLGGRGFRCRDLLAKSFMVMQDVNHQLFTESVLDEVLLSLGKGVAENERVRRAEDILRSLDLFEPRDTHPMALSGGQKQRVAIASAIASDKDIILFDEPTSGLDLRHMKEVSENIRGLKATGKSIFIITHDLELILESCEHVIRVEDGRISESFPIDEETMGRLAGFFLERSAAPGE